MSKTFEVVTDRIVKILESGTVPWRKTWAEGAGLGEHQNLISQHGYRGINAMVTAASGFNSPYWLTYKQAVDHGGQVKRGEKSTPIVFWKFGCKENQDGEEKSWAFANYSNVFNLDQIEGMDSVKLLAKRRKANKIEFKPIETCEKIASTYLATGPMLEHREQRAFYRPSTDSVNMPKRESFDSVEAYYATLFHELTHSTGHGSRIGRNGITDKNYFGSHAYSKEELIAEMGSAFLCSHAGIDTPTIDNSAAYIQSWLNVLKSDSKLVLQAASQAQKAFDLIVGGAK